MFATLLVVNAIADAKGMEMDELIQLMEQIVYSGTKLNIEYWIDEILDEDQQEELHDYFIEAETDSLDAAMEEFDGDFDYEELNLYRLSFLSKLANDHIIGSGNIIFFNIRRNQFKKRFTIFLSFCLTHTVNMRKLVYRNWIFTDHIFQRRILEYNKGWNIEFMSFFLPQIF